MGRPCLRADHRYGAAKLQHVEQNPLRVLYHTCQTVDAQHSQELTVRLQSTSTLLYNVYAAATEICLFNECALLSTLVEMPRVFVSWPVEPMVMSPTLAAACELTSPGFGAAGKSSVPTLQSVGAEFCFLSEAYTACTRESRYGRTRLARCLDATLLECVKVNTYVYMYLHCNGHQRPQQLVAYRRPLIHIRRLP